MFFPYSPPPLVTHSSYCSDGKDSVEKSLNTVLFLLFIRQGTNLRRTLQCTLSVLLFSH